MESGLNTSMCHKWIPIHHLPLAVISKATDSRPIFSKSAQKLFSK